ncbi:MAG: hypothetical protein SXQ77_07035 [Halobacteria archaeon]|nr:hypothetical protein [Halobacteria archaeon]
MSEIESETTEPESETKLQSRFAKPTLKFAVALIVLFVAQRISVTVQATNEVKIAVPTSSETITFAQLLTSIITLLIVAAILIYASEIGAVLADFLPEFSQIKRIVMLTGGIISLVIVHHLFSWVLQYRPMYAEEYDLGFLIAGMLLGGWIGLILYLNVGNIYQVLKQVPEKQE